jgi:hypothetical protein
MAWSHSQAKDSTVISLVRLLLAQIRLIEGIPLIARSNLRIAEMLGIAEQDSELYEDIRVQLTDQPA